jgi:protein-S-isoprenylcysteine O-methyltransferase Ste14
MKLYAKSAGLSLDPAVHRVYLGIALSQASIVIVMAGAMSLWRARTTINPLDPTKATSLVTGGAFRFSRNPMYVSLLILLVAYAERLNSVIEWLGPLFYVAYMTYFQILPEERALHAKFGEAFVRYKARTRRWL